MITLEQAKSLKYGDVIYHATDRNMSGERMRFKVNGKPKTWKRDPDRIKVPIKYGLFGYGEVTNGTWEGNRFTLHLDAVSLA
jgi:hypothetical protein